MKRMIELTPYIFWGVFLFAVAANGDGTLTPQNCWDNHSEAPSTKLSDLGVVGFLQHARVASLDEKLAARLVLIRSRMTFSRLPKKVTSHEESIPVTLIEAADYLNRYTCMSYPPILCIETDDAFFFSGGRSTTPVYDFSSGMAIMKEDGAIWTWDYVEAEKEAPAAE